MLYFYYIFLYKCMNRTVSLLKLGNSDVKAVGRLTLGISNVAAPGGVEIGPV